MIKSTVRRFYEEAVACAERINHIDEEVRTGLKTPIEGEAYKIIAKTFFHRKADAIWFETPLVMPQPGDEEIFKMVYESMGIDINKHQ